ncbi:MAG: spermidine synthase [Streptosporangiales bacterium]|nr:spermidine synthase [Streptosporangiales bacterium]
MDGTVERVRGPSGELALRRAGGHFEIISNGVFLMDTRDGRSERALVAAALDGPRGPYDVLIGGLGVGFSLREALDTPGTRRVTVVEIEPAVITWNRGPLGAVVGEPLNDPRTEVVNADLVAWIRAGTGRYDAICLDIDNGPGWTVTEENAGLYTGAGLDALIARLAPGGRLAVWSAAAAPEFARRLESRFDAVRTVEVPVPRGEPDVVYVSSGPRTAGR